LDHHSTTHNTSRRGRITTKTTPAPQKLVLTASLLTEQTHHYTLYHGLREHPALVANHHSGSVTPLLNSAHLVFICESLGRRCVNLESLWQHITVIDSHINKGKWRRGGEVTAEAGEAVSTPGGEVTAEAEEAVSTPGGEVTAEAGEAVSTPGGEETT
ncbi:hypothetical protein Hamer_G010548, partial [Homarus americanus]